ALVFTGGIGEKAHYVREEVCSYLKYLGLGIDGRKNRHNKEDITSNGSRVKVYVIPTDEEFQIAKETELILG
ncbi:MAG: acetate kinase, partial [Nanobdellota archaeon]